MVGGLGSVSVEKMRCLSYFVTQFFRHPKHLHERRSERVIPEREDPEWVERILQPRKSV
jgi:hypothetical protein